MLAQLCNTILETVTTKVGARKEVTIVGCNLCMCSYRSDLDLRVESQRATLRIKALFPIDYGSQLAFKVDIIKHIQLPE